MRVRKNTKKNIIRKMAARILLLGVLTAAAVSPLHLGNEFLRSTDFDTVEVTRRDSVLKIAARYTAGTGDAQELAEAIIEVNGLPADGSLRAGQKIRIPILRDRLPKVAER